MAQSRTRSAESSKSGNAGVYDPSKPFNEQIKALISSTHPTSGPIIVRPFGKRFTIRKQSDLFKNRSEMNAVDGIGTKGLLHWQMNTMEAGAQDAFAMVVDDLIESGHIPTIMQDHIQIQEENQERILRIVRALTELARANTWKMDDAIQRPIIINGGETAIINTLQGIEVGINGTGYAHPQNLVEPSVIRGDVIIGIASSGAHSNGYSFFRKEILGNRGKQLDDKLTRTVTFGEELTKPTRVYLPAIKALLLNASRQHLFPNDVIHGMVHITGGGLSKLKELLPASGKFSIKINADHKLKPQPIFNYSFETGVSSKDMYLRFNNGIGYVVAVDKDYAADTLRILRRHYPADVIGEVIRGPGKVLIDSSYEKRVVKF